MNPLTNSEVERLRAAAEATMQDHCVVGVLSEADWGASADGKSWTYSTTVIACGLETGRSDEVPNGSEATITDTTIRLPLDTLLAAGARLKVTHRQGIALGTPEVYAVIGATQAGVSCQRCRCKRVTGESQQ